MFHTLRFLISNLQRARQLAYVVVVLELLLDRLHPLPLHEERMYLASTIGQVIVGGGLVFAVGVWLGKLGAAP